MTKSARRRQDPIVVVAVVVLVCGAVFAVGLGALRADQQGPLFGGAIAGVAALGVALLTSLTTDRRLVTQLASDRAAANREDAIEVMQHALKAHDIVLGHCLARRSAERPDAVTGDRAALFELVKADNRIRLRPDLSETEARGSSVLNAWDMLKDHMESVVRKELDYDDSFYSRFVEVGREAVSRLSV